MNLTIPFYNETITNYGDIPVKCMVREYAYDIDCLYKTICPQYNQYFIKIGLIIIISYIVIMFLKWLFLKHLYKLTPNKKCGFWGNFYNIETRIYWDNFINARLGKLMLGYIAVVVYLSIRMW